MKLSKIVKSISKERGVNAIALGGSQSRNEAHEHLDFDISLYYDANMLDHVALGQSLKELDDRHQDNLLHPPGEWGPGINGGAWMIVDDIPVDILLRELKRLKVLSKNVLRAELPSIISADIHLFF